MATLSSERSGSGFASWGPIFAGGLAATALSSVLLGFGVAVGLSVASASPSWRDASAALALLSGLYLILQALVTFGLGGYIAGRTRIPAAAGPTDVTERSDGIHGLLTWALAVVFGAGLAALVTGLGATNKTNVASPSATAAEPLLSYEIDRLFRAPRRPANADISIERAEAGRILLTSAGHNGIAPEDRTYLVQQVAALTALPPADAERRVDDVIGKSRTAIRKSRQTAVILAFSGAAAILLGAAAAWSAAAAGGRHRDGEPLPRWMSHGDFLTRRRNVPGMAAGSRTAQPLPE